MLPEVGASELILIAVVALIVVGPKDLPLLLRRIGQFMAKLRSMASEFRASFDDMARQSELDDLRKEVEAMRRGATSDLGDAADMASTVSDIEGSLSGVQLHPPMSYQFSATDTGPAELEAPKPARKRAAATNAAPKKAAPDKAKPAAKPVAQKPAAKKAPAKKTAT